MTYLAFLQVLLLLILCLSSLCIFSVGGYSDGGASNGSSANSSGSGNGGEVDIPHCADILTREDDQGTLLTSSTGYTAAMCSILCMEDITSNPEYQDTEFENLTDGGVWTFHFFPEFSSQNHRRNCPAYREFAECVRGCLIRALNPNAIQFSRRQCRDECFDECKDESDIDNHYFNPYCTIDCNKGYCRQGCEHYHHIVRSSNTSGSPSGPVLPPQIVQLFLNGQVILNISHSVPSASNDGHPVGLIYRVVDQMTHFTKYFYKEHPDEPLLLGDFSCRQVSVSFVLVNQFGSSPESPLVNLTIPGRNVIVSKPEDLQVEIELDKRPGFFGYVIVTLSWSNSEGFIKYLLHYVVKIHSYNSHNRPDSFISSLITNTSLTVRDTIGNRLLVYGAQVKIEVCTVLNTNEKCAELNSYSIEEFKRLMGRNPVNITDCIATWTRSDYTFTLHWIIPEFMAYGDGIFSTFHLSIEERIAKRFIDSYSIPKIANKTSYSSTWSNLPPMASQNHYVFRVTPQWTDSDIYQNPTIDDAICIKNAVPPPSSPVLNVTMSDVDLIDGNIQFKFQWEPPTHPNGEVTVYIACFGGHELPNFEKNPGSVVDGNGTTCEQINSKEIHANWKHTAPHHNSLYFQIRANTKLGGGGEWSETIVIQVIPPSFPPYTSPTTPIPTPTPTPTRPSPSTSDQSSQTPLILGSVVAGVILSLIIGVTIAIVLLCVAGRRHTVKDQPIYDTAESPSNIPPYSGQPQNYEIPQSQEVHLISLNMQENNAYKQVEIRESETSADMGQTSDRITLEENVAYQ